MRRRAAALALLPLLALLPPRTARAESKPEVLQLESGITAVLRRVRDADAVGVAILFPVGREADPADAHGLADVAMRLFATAAAGTLPARPPIELLQVTREGARRRAVSVERDHGALRLLVEKGAVAEALDEVAARLTALRATAAQLEAVRKDLSDGRRPIREWLPIPAVENAARQTVRGHAPDQDPIASVDELAALSWEQVSETLAKRCVTRGAFVAIVGDFEASAVRALVKKTLGALPLSAPPEPPPSASDSPPAPPDPAVLHLRAPMGGGARQGQGPQVAVALRAAGKADASSLAPLLVLAARLLEPQRLGQADASSVVTLDMLADPQVLLVRAPLPPGQTPESSAQMMRAVFANAARGSVNAKDLLALHFWFNGPLGLPLLETSRALDVPFAAYADACRQLRGWDGAAFFDALKSLKEADLKKAVADGTIRGAAALIDG